MMTSWFALLLLAAQGTKLPVPSAAEQATVEKELRRMWKADYAALPAQRASVAKKFLARGREIFEGPFKYVIFREARELATQAGDAATALGAIEAMTASFGTEGVAEKAAALARIEGLAKSPEDLKPVLALELELVDEAIALGRLETAAAVLSRVAGRAGKDESRDLAKRLNHALEIRAAMAGVKDWASPWMYVNPNDLSRGTQNQRENVWTSSPKAPDQPFKWVRTVRLTRVPHILHVDVSANVETTPGGAWTLVVLANGDELARKLITGGRWQALEINLGAYSNRTVTLEVANAPGNGSPSDRAYWSNLHILPPPLAEVIPSDHDPRRAPIPDAAQQARAEKLIPDPLQVKGGAGPSERLESARKLLEEARKATGDSLYQYVLLRKARDLGVQTGDLKTISESIDLMGGSFCVDPFEEKLALFSKVESTRKTAEGAEGYLRVAEEALAAGKSEAALHALSRARAVRIPAASAKAKELSGPALETLSKGWASQWLWQDTAPGQIVQDTFNKRPYAWQTQPAVPERPFKWKRKAKLPAGQPCRLHLDVSSRPPDDHHGLEWTLQVVVNGKELLSKQVRGVEWRHYVVDLSAHAGREVELELCNRSDDGHGHGQTGYWDKVYLSYEP
ncbi:MAG TPA: hypothetical protein VJB14_15815 [Planctomycetota bacterium]|nr:hypothetical protein [Planctomycetota bacterium]